MESSISLFEVIPNINPISQALYFLKCYRAITYILLNYLLLSKKCSTLENVSKVFEMYHMVHRPIQIISA